MDAFKIKYGVFISVCDTKPVPLRVGPVRFACLSQPHTRCSIGLTGKLPVVSWLVAFGVRIFDDTWPETMIKEEENINIVELNSAMPKLSISREDVAHAIVVIAIGKPLPRQTKTNYKFPPQG